MAFIIKDRVKEATTSTGTGAVSLGGAAATFDTFQSYMTNGDTTYYAIVHTTSGVDEWEVGLGTWNTGNTITRTTVLAGSNGTSAVNFSAGAKDVFMTYPAAHAALAGDDVTFANITVTGTVDGRDVAADGTKLDTVETNADVTDAVNVAAAGALMKSGGTMTGNLILNADPTTALGAATKEYVDTIAAAGIHYHTPVRVETPSALNATYDNGSSGVGATLTNAGTQAALVIDGVTVATNDRVLVYNQTNAAHNGIYTVTNTGSASTNWVLTRATDADSYGASDPNAMGEGDAYFVKEGDTGAGELYVMNTSGTITFGTTDITFTVIAETAVYSAGTGMSLNGTTFSIGQDVGTTANVTFNQVTAAIIGNVTGNLTGNVTGNADTATALETARTIQLSGDVTGSATFDGTANINITAAVQDDSHAHVISNVDGLQAALDAKADDTTTITAGNGLTGGGSIGANRTLNVGAGSGISVTADAVAHADTSTQASVNNSGNTFIQDVTLDGFGHVTGLTSGSVSVGDATITIAAGGGLQTGGDFTTNQSTNETITLAHADTSSQASVNNSGGTVIQDITLDGYGHITSVGSVNLDARYYTETEADSRFVNVTGDSMTGPLSITGNASYVGNYGYSTLVLQDNSGYPGIDFRYSDKDWLQRMEAGGSMQWAYRSGGNHTERMELTTGGLLYLNSNQRVFADNYHPNADKWTTARTLTLSGDASGSVSWDGSANATLTVDVGNAQTVDGYNAPQIYNGSHSYLGGYYQNGNTGQKPNNSVLGSGKMKLTMQSNSNLGFGGSWNDVLWMSSYTGTDVKKSTALVSSKYDDTSLWIAKQNYDSSSWGTGYLIWNSGNDGSGSGLDADLLDGYHESTFMRRIANSHLDMNNYSITEVNLLKFNDPGPNEGVEWVGGNGWKIYESPDDLTTNSGGNLQFVTGSTRRMTLNSGGSLVLGGANLTIGIGSTSSNIYMTDSDNTTRRIHCNSNRIGFLNSSNGWSLYSENGGRTVAESGIYNPALLDMGTTGSLQYKTNDNGGYIPHPRGGSYISTTSAVTGAIKIAFPTATHGATDMLSFWVDIYDYTANESVTLFIAGYLYQTTGNNEWHNCEVINITGNSAKDYTVRFGADGSRNCVWIGETTSTWSYPQVLVRDLHVGYTASVGNYDTGFSISVVTAFDTVDETLSNNFPQARNSQYLGGVAAGSYLRSDADDTLTGNLQITGDLTVYSATNGAGAKITFSDHAGGSYAQRGTLTYYHGDGAVSSEPQTSNDGWVFAGTEPNTVVRVQGDVDVDQDLNVNNDIYVGDQIIHVGDTDTYLQFHNNDQFRVVIAGAEVMEWGANYAKLSDSDSLYLGAGSDFRMWHDGTNTYFRNYHHSGGNIYFQGENTSGVNHGLLYMHCNTSRTYVRLFENSSERLRTMSYGISVTGELRATSNITAYYSDERLKTKVGGIENPLDKVKSLEGFYYVENDVAKEHGFDNEEQQVALSAQAVQEVMPEAVDLAPFDTATDDDGNVYSKSGEEYLTVDYARLVPLLVESIKELEKRVAELEAKQ